MSEWFIGLDYAGQLAAWLVASFLLYFLASQIAWQYRYPGRDDPLGRWIDRLRAQPFSPWLEEAIRLIYYLGIPFMAAINGLLAADLLGISGTDWVPADTGVQGFLWEDWVRGLGLVLLAVLAMRGAWFAGCLVARRIGRTPVMPDVPRPIWQRLLNVLYDQIHWAFYRSGPILWLDDLYGGTWAGLALVLLAAAFNPAHRWALKGPETAGPLLLRLGAAWSSALLFVATQNLWLTIAAHLILVGLLSGPEAGDYPYAGPSAP